MDVTKYLALLDQFLTKDIIGSCALAKIINVMIDSEMSQKQKIDMICSIISTISLSFPLAFINLIFDSALQFYMTCIQVSLVLTTTLFIVLQLPEVTASTIWCPVTTPFSNSRKLGRMKLPAADFS